ncbi:MULTISPECIES: hypothetical protein [unclassified Nonomuraea]|uniref:hypothetical protein n=1 Tax=unclassified Nonomuraea TaxID=2593643 RepID=UPI0033C06E8A
MTVMLPPQLEIAFQALGVPWPTQDEDGLRAGAAAYRECAAALAVQVTPLVRESLGRAAGGNAGLHMEAVAAFWDELDREDDRSGHLSRLATTLHVLAYLTDEAGGLRLIDNALSHPRSHTRAMRSPFLVAYRDEPLSPGVVADLRALDLEEEARLLRESGFGHREIRGRLRRLQELREHGMITSSAWRGHIQSGDSW